MKNSVSSLPSTALCALALTTFILTGCSDSTGDVETAKTSPASPPPPVSVAAADEGIPVESNDDLPDFADEPTFADPGNENPTELAAGTPPAPENIPQLDPLQLPEPAPVDDSWREQWITSFEQAKAQAQAENKDILINFTGSDWCTWCIRLAQEVFSQPGFAEYAKEKFVLVEADFPQNQFGRPEAIDPQHEELADQYEFQGFPTIMLFDRQGRPYAQTGYQPGGPEAYNAHLEEFRLARVDRDTAFAAAEKLKGEERAGKLDEALSNLPSELLFPAYESVVKEIIQLDENDTAQLGSQYKDRLAQHQFMTRIQAIEQKIQDTENPDEVLAEIASVAKEFGDNPRRSFITTMFQISVLNYFDRIDEVLAVAAEALKSDSLDDDYRADLFMTQLRILNQAERQKDALKIADDAIAYFKENDALTMQFLIARADFLNRLDRVEEGRASIAEARKLGGPAAAFQIDQIEQQIFGSVAGDGKPAEPETSGSDKEPESTSDAAKPAGDQPASDQ